MNGKKIKAALAGITGSLVLFSTAWSQQLPPEDIKKVKEAIPYVMLSKEIYEHKVENDSNRDLKVGNWERIRSTRASFKEAYNESSTTALVNKLRRDGSLSAEDIRQIQLNDGKLDSDIANIFSPKDPISFHAEVYKNEDGKRAIVFEGTGSSEDWIADFAHVRKVPDQYKKALEFTNKIAQTCGCNKNDIVVTGHSLGGGLAQYVAMNIEADVKAYTFNPAGLWDSTAVSIDTGKAANITNFIADGYLYSDVVSKTGVVFGKKIPVAVSAILVHSIDGLKDAMVALAGSQVKSLAQTNEPRLPFIERDKEIDFFAAKWRLLKPFPLYAKEGSGTVIKILPKGLKIDGLSLAVHTLSYAVAELKKPLTRQFSGDNFNQATQQREFFTIPLQRGDKIAYISYFGEGECRVWVKGRTYISDCFDGGVDDELVRNAHYSGDTNTTHWASVKTPDGSKGWLWIKDADFNSIQGISKHGESVGE